MLLVLQACITTPGSGSDGDRVQSFLQTRPALSSSPLPPHFLETPCGTVLRLLPHLPFYGHLPITVYTALASAVFSLKQPTLAPGMMGCPCHLTGRLLTREFSSCCHSLSLPSPQPPGSSFCCHRSPKTDISRLTLPSQRSFPSCLGHFLPGVLFSWFLAINLSEQPSLVPHRLLFYCW